MVQSFLEWAKHSSVELFKWVRVSLGRQGLLGLQTLWIWAVQMPAVAGAAKPSKRMADKIKDFIGPIFMFSLV